ncbi:MAG: hypothetical protein EYC62_00375 [Alphaproteobacteria bacterium]|nr:MAG: hypothetical protein EYC62_00375 [Alphaproteobacteria bacterium]
MSKSIALQLCDLELLMRARGVRVLLHAHGYGVPEFTVGESMELAAMIKDARTELGDTLKIPGHGHMTNSAFLHACHQQRARTSKR